MVFNILVDKRISCILYLQVGGVGIVRLCGWSGIVRLCGWSGIMRLCGWSGIVRLCGGVGTEVV